jgi:hypothetical protein
LLPRVDGASRNGGAVAPAGGGFNGMSLSTGDGEISGGVSVPGATSVKGAVAPAGGGVRALPGAGDRWEAGGGEAVPGVCAELTVTATIVTTRLKAAVRHRPSETSRFAAAESLQPTCILDLLPIVYLE